ncbi:MAG: hypothetical protein B6I28_00545 [Fusobacteriia bacterium 4572_132]|nr:MAG: hypothetical protein B6I28_00545 [Fusobacteriia bacterium 4572_132]
MKSKRALGRGLGALIPDEIKEALDSTGQITEIHIKDIFPNKNQPRKQFEEEKIKNLSDSIKEHGILQPIVVRKKKNKYEIIAGERRYRASKKVGLEKIPAIVKDFDDALVAEISLVENLQRENLSVLDEANAYDILIKKYAFTQDKIAKSVGKSRSNITNILRLLKLDDEIKEYLNKEKITAGHARALLNINNINLQKKLAEKIFKENLSVREVENIIRKLSEKKTKKNVKKIDFELLEIEKDLKGIFGTKYSISWWRWNFI